MYDRIGKGYATYRHADPRIESAIHHGLGPARTVLNVGAGTGSYEPKDRCVLAVEPSGEMIRQRPTGSAPCLQAGIESLRFAPGAFDATMAVLTVHHWPVPLTGIAELARVGRGVVIFMFDPQLHNTFWLFRDYFPAMTRLPSTVGAISVDETARAIGADRIVKVLIPYDCVDGFGWAYWRRPKAYLDPAVRRCISAFGQVSPDEVTSGIAALRSDIDTGRWDDRHAELLEKSAIDGGFRLVIRDMR
ncbi:MAG: class I SAM-dependent methyltransferase [Acidimicrobiales bacterium]